MNAINKSIATPDAGDVKTIMREERWNSRHAKAYNRYRWLSSQERWRALLNQELAVVLAGSEIFEVGSGTGFITEILVRSGYRVRGMDLSPAMLELARRNLAAAGLADRASFAVGDAETLDAPNNYAAAVVSRWVLWTLPRPRQALSEMARVLAPGGKLICVDGQQQSMGPFARWRSALVDLVIAGRLPGWRTPCYARVKPSLPCLDGPEVADILRKYGLAEVAFRRISAAESEGQVKHWLMGANWQSYLVTGVKPR